MTSPLSSTVAKNLTDAIVEAAAEAMHNLEYPTYSPTAVEDSNRWSWRGDGHLGPDGETGHYDGYRTAARAALAAALPLLAEAVEGLVVSLDRHDPYTEAVVDVAALIRSAVPAVSP